MSYLQRAFETDIFIEIKQAASLRILAVSLCGMQMLGLARVDRLSSRCLC